MCDIAVLRFRRCVLSVPDDVWHGMNRWLNWSAVVFGGMTVESLETRWQDRPRARLRDEYVLAVFCGCSNRHRIIQGPDVDPNSVQPTLKGQRKFGAAFFAVVNIDVLSTSSRRQRIDRGFFACEGKGVALENGLDHSVRARGTLTEPTIADRNPKRIASDIITDIPAKTAACVVR